MNLTTAQNDALAAVLAENDVGKWDGTRIRALIAMLQKWLPLILPYILPLIADHAEKVGFAEVGDVEVETENLSAVDWAALIKLIVQIISVLFPTVEPTPTPNPGPIA